MKRQTEIAYSPKFAKYNSNENADIYNVYYFYDLDPLNSGSFIFGCQYALSEWRYCVSIKHEYNGEGCAFNQKYA